MGDLITEDTVRAGALQDVGQARFEGDGGTIWQHTTIPRLSAIDRPPGPDEARRPGASPIREWMVDGRLAGSLDDAIARLNVPLTLSEDEELVLTQISEDWTELKAFRGTFSGAMTAQVSPILARLHRKGLIENDLRPVEGRSVSWIRRTPTIQPSASATPR